MGSGNRNEPAAYAADNNIEELLERDPRVAGVLATFGLKCVDCIVAPTESLAQGCRPLGVDVAEVVAALNALPAPL